MGIYRTLRNFYDGHDLPPLSFTLGATTIISGMLGVLSGAIIEDSVYKGDAGIAGVAQSAEKTREYSENLRVLAVMDGRLQDVTRQKYEAEAAVKLGDTSAEAADKMRKLQNSYKVMSVSFNNSMHDFSSRIVLDQSLSEKEAGNLMSQTGSSITGPLRPIYADTDYLRECQLIHAKQGAGGDIAANVAAAQKISACSSDKSYDTMKYSIGAFEGGAFSIILGAPFAVAARRRRKYEQAVKKKNDNETTLKVTVKRPDGSK